MNTLHNALRVIAKCECKHVLICGHNRKCKQGIRTEFRHSTKGLKFIYR